MKLFYNYVSKILNEPKKPQWLSSSAQWLSGVGAWFQLEIENGLYRISRYNLAGKLEFSYLFNIVGNAILNLNEHFRFTYVSHSYQCVIEQNEKQILFRRH